MAAKEEGSREGAVGELTAQELLPDLNFFQHHVLKVGAVLPPSVLHRTVLGCEGGCRDEDARGMQAAYWAQHANEQGMQKNETYSL